MEALMDNTEKFILMKILNNRLKRDNIINEELHQKVDLYIGIELSKIKKETCQRKIS